MEKSRKNKEKNRGFSILELIIVIAVMAILVVVIAPMFLKYVERSRRTTDANNAANFAEATRLVLTENEMDTRFPGKNKTWGSSWNKNTVVNTDNPTTLLDYFAEAVGGELPHSLVYPDYDWYIFYNSENGLLETIYIAKNPKSYDDIIKNGYQLWPDPSDYIAGKK